MTNVRVFATFVVAAVLVLTGCAKRIAQPDLAAYPRVANYYLLNQMPVASADTLAKYDVIVVAAENQLTSPKTLKRIHKLNRKALVVAYYASNEITYDGLTKPTMAFWKQLAESLGENDWLHNTDGSYNVFWPGCRTYNLTQKATADKLVRFIVRSLDRKLCDGVFIDNIWYDVANVFKGQVDADRNGVADDRAELSRQWVANERYLLAELRRQLGPKIFILANEGGANQMVATLNGRMFEGWPQTLPTVDLSLVAYRQFNDSAATPSAIIVHSGGKQSDERAVRFGLGFTLLGDGFFAYDVGPSFHACLWWYPEFDVPLGAPLGPAKDVPELGIWMREFTGGVVLWNPTYDAKTITLLNPTDNTRQDVRVPMRDAVIQQR